MTQSPRGLTFVNALGALGYLSTLVQWAWSLILVGYPLLNDKNFLNFNFSQSAVPATPIQFELGVFTPIAIALSLVFASALIVYTIYAIIKLPSTVGKTAASVTHKTAAAVIPTVTRHQKVSRKRFIKLSYTITVIIKIVLMILPFTALLVVSPPSELSRDLLIITGAYCLFWTALYFGLQLLFVTLLKIDHAKVW